MKHGSTGSVAAVALGAAVVVVFLFFRGTVHEAVYPAERATGAVSRSVFSRLAGAYRGAEAEAENIRLRQELAALKLEVSELSRLKPEVERLRERLGYSGGKFAGWISAEVISRSGGAAAVRHSLRIGKGSLDGIGVGAIAAVPEGLVGKVVSVSPHTAEVRLITDTSIHVAAELGERPGCGRYFGIVSGSGGGLQFQHSSVRVPDDLSTGVWTSGVGGVFPGGLRIGAYADGCITPAVDLATLDGLFIRR